MFTVGSEVTPEVDTVEVGHGEVVPFRACKGHTLRSHIDDIHRTSQEWSVFTEITHSYPNVSYSQIELLNLHLQCTIAVT